MKKVVLSLVLLSAVLLSAVQPGLPASDISFIKQFRLPAWKYDGYGFSISGMGYNKCYDAGRYNRKESYDLTLNPNYQSRNESEGLISEYKIDLNGNFNYYRKSRTDYKNISRTITVNPILEFSRKYYQSSQGYVNLAATVNYGYNYKHGDNSYYYENFESDTVRHFTTNFLAGFGTGKVRDVTPVIRALRFRKRYNSLGKADISESEVKELAKVMSKYPGYKYVHERSGKNFWDAAFYSLGSKMDGLSGYQTFMITDALKEEVGTRLEGSEVNFNLQYTRYEANHDGIFADYVTAIAGPILNSRMYTNLSIKHQVGVELMAGFFFPTSDIKPFDNSFLGSFRLTQLYSLVDRILYNFDARFTIQNENYGYSSNGGVVLEVFNNFSYYLEDNLYLSLNVDYLFQKFEHAIIGDIYYYEDYEFYSSDYGFYDNIYEEFGQWNFGIDLNYRFRTM